MKFERLFRLFLHATALWAFTALVSTGQIHIPAVALGYLALGAAALGLGRRLPSGWIMTLLTTAVFLTGVAAVFLGADIIYSLVYFFLFVEVVKLLTGRRNRDYLQVLILTFFQMVAASVMTYSLSFAGIFIVYAFLLTGAWILFSMRRDAECADALTEKTLRRATRYQELRRGAPVPVLEGASATQSHLDHRTLPGRGFFASNAWIAFTLLVGAGALFLVIPRFSTERFLTGLEPFGAARKRSGLSDQVDFSTLGEIQLDPTIVARVELSGPSAAQSRPASLRLRATSLDLYTGRTWRKSGFAYDNQWPVDARRLYFAEAAPEGRPFFHTILLEPEDNLYFIAASTPGEFVFERTFSLSMDRLNASLQPIARTGKAIRYRALSILPDENLADTAVPESAAAQASVLSTEASGDGEKPPHAPLREMIASGRELARLPARIFGAGGRLAPSRASASQAAPLDAGSRRMRALRFNYPREIPWIGAARSLPKGGAGYLTLSLNWLGMGERGLPPPLVERFTQMPDIPDMNPVRALAAEWSRGATTPLSTARAIERRLSQDYAYTTRVEFKNPDLHLTSFLTERREGHCEYFATAMTLMLRSLGIPARLVTGYYTDDWNDSGNYFIVRRQHAHSWVEAWIEPHGWVTFDPSPSDGVGFNRIGGAAFFRYLSHQLDALRYHWYRYVIDFDLQDQFRMAGIALDWRWALSLRGRKFLAPLRLKASDFLMRAQRLGPGRTLLLAALFAAGAAIAWALAREVFRRIPRKRGAAGGGPAPSPARARGAIYLEALRALEERDLRRGVGQTPLEFAGAVARARPEWSEFLALTHAYYRARFRDEDWAPGELERARRFLDILKRGQQIPASAAS